MLATLSFLLSAALVAVTVYCLHKMRAQEIHAGAERSAPLPPLRQTVTFTPELRDAPALPPKSSQETLDRLAESKEFSDHEPSWMQQVAMLKTEGRLTAALELCVEHYPLWGAYQQSCLILRQMFRQAADETQASEILEKLYRNACEAEFLHEKRNSGEQMTLGQLRTIPSSQLRALAMPYQAIGYTRLRLIKKTDIKAMLAFWGKPSAHQSPREHHLASWNDLLQRYGTAA